MPEVRNSVTESPIIQSGYGDTVIASKSRQLNHQSEEALRSYHQVDDDHKDPTEIVLV